MFLCQGTSFFTFIPRICFQHSAPKPMAYHNPCTIVLLNRAPSIRAVLHWTHCALLTRYQPAWWNGMTLFNFFCVTPRIEHQQWLVSRCYIDLYLWLKIVKYLHFYVLALEGNSLNPSRSAHPQLVNMRRKQFWWLQQQHLRATQLLLHQRPLLSLITIADGVIDFSSGAHSKKCAQTWARMSFDELTRWTLHLFADFALRLSLNHRSMSWKALGRARALLL